MFRLARTFAIVLAVLAGIGAGVQPLLAIDPDRDFSGQWILDPSSVKTRAPDRLTIVQQDTFIQCSSPNGAQWNLALDGSDTRYQIGKEQRNSKTKWEGSALLVNTIVSGPQNYSELDRWTLSRDRAMLIVERQTVRNGSESTSVLYYRREGAPVAAAKPVVSAPQSQAALSQPSPPANQPDITVKAGTRIPLSLRNAINTKLSHEDDRVYLDTIYPVVVDNRIVIPRGSYVSGTLTKVKPAGVVGHKGELYIRFDSLILPNGTSRDFRSRLDNADTTHGKVDRQEGTITGERDKSGEAKTTAEGAGIGAGIGGLAGAAAGHPISGLGIGAAAGAAVGLATVMSKHRADVTLPKGTTIEMLLDRDLHYLLSELPRQK